jgi:hypothetical protein
MTHITHTYLSNAELIWSSLHSKLYRPRCSIGRYIVFCSEVWIKCTDISIQITKLIHD